MNETKAQIRPYLVGGGILLLFGAYLLAFLLPDFWRSLGGPEPMTLAAAEQTASDEQLYVAITDGQWQCDTIRYVVDSGGSRSTGRTTRVTKVFLTNQTGEVTALAAMSGEWNCAELQATQPSGYLTRAGVELTLCGYCGQSNSLIGLLFAFALTAAGLGLFIFGGLQWRNYKKQNHDFAEKTAEDAEIAENYQRKLAKIRVNSLLFSEDTNHPLLPDYIHQQRNGYP